MHTGMFSLFARHFASLSALTTLVTLACELLPERDHNMKKYQTPRSHDYVMRTKSHIQRLLTDRNLSHVDLAGMTGIHRNTIQRWLSTNSNNFMDFADAAVIAEKLGLSVMDLCPPPLWSVDRVSNHLAQLSRVGKWPTDHIEAAADFYATLFPDTGE